MSWLVSTWYGFLIRCFFLLFAFIIFFFITSSHVSRYIIVLWSIERLLLVEAPFHVENGQLLSIAEGLTGLYMVCVVLYGMYSLMFF